MNDLSQKDIDLDKELEYNMKTIREIPSDRASNSSVSVDDVYYNMRRYPIKNVKTMKE